MIQTKLVATVLAIYLFNVRLVTEEVHLASLVFSALVALVVVTKESSELSITSLRETGGNELVRINQQQNQVQGNQCKSTAFRALRSPQGQASHSPH